MLESITNAINTVNDIEIIIIRISIILCDMLGVLVLITTVAKSIYCYFHRDHHIKLTLAQGIALALEFKLAGEVLRTVTVRELNELFILGVIIILRTAITILIHWEIKTEKAEQEHEIEIQKKEMLEVQLKRPFE